MNILKNSEIDLQNWRAFIQLNKYENPFCTPEFFQLYNNFSFNASVLAVEENASIKAMAVITLQSEKGLKSFFSRRAIIYGGILCNEKKHLDFLLKNVAKQFKNKAIYIEVRNYFDYSEFYPVFKNNNWNYIDYTDVLIPLDKFSCLEDYLNKLDYNRRREINLSLKNGATYSETTDIVEIKELYEILKQLYKEKVKLPIPPFEFFLSLSKNAIGKIFVVKHNNVVIGGAITLFMEGKNLYTLYYCGIRNYDKKIFPTHLAILASVNFSIENNIPYVDMMGAGRKNEEYGVRDYKLKFGGELVEYGRFRYILNPTLFKLGEFALKTIKRIT